MKDKSWWSKWGSEMRVFSLFSWMPDSWEILCMFRFPLIWHRFTKYNITFCRFLFCIDDMHYKNKSKVKKKYFFQLREGFYWEMCDNNFRGQVWSYLLKSKITEKLAPLHVFFIIWAKSQQTREDFDMCLVSGFT